MNMMQLPLAGAGMNTSAAVLKIDGLDLMFRQSEIRTLESASDVDGSDPREKSVGWIRYMRQRWPVYCLSEQLELLGSVPASRRTCVVFAIETGYVGVLCDDVSILKQVAGQSHEVPPAMKKADTPILGLVPHNGGLLSASHSNRLAAYIEHRVQNSIE